MMPELVEAEWLAARLDEPGLRILDATIQIDPAAGIRSGRADWEATHVPGSCFADLFELSDPTAPAYTLTMPAATWFSEKMGRLGVGDGTHVVVYDARENMWAARLWWMLRTFGFDDAAVLNGGWAAWQHEQRPICRQTCSYPPATFSAHR